MDEVVLGAIDPSHPLANEQARLVSKYLKLVVDRLDFAYERNRFELAHYLEVATALQGDARRLSQAIGQLLVQATEEARELCNLPGAPAPALRAAAMRLAAILTALVRTAESADPETRQRVESTILDAAGALLAAQRAWFLPQGWEPDASGIPPIEVALETGPVF
jgi:hypothetical protein